MTQKNNYFVLTGTPGSGKTSLLREIAELGFMTCDEPARLVIAEQRKCGGMALPEVDPKLFCEKLLLRSVQNFGAFEDFKEPVIFDRGIPDVIGYARSYELSLRNFEQAANEHKYHNKVFVLQPWEEIYRNDDERKMTFQQALVFHKYLEEAYLKAGYELIRVPFLSLKARAKFVLENLP